MNEAKSQHWGINIAQILNPLMDLSRRGGGHIVDGDGRRGVVVVVVVVMMIRTAI